VLEKDGDQLKWSCGKWSITYIQGGKEYPTCNKKKEGYLAWSRLA